METDQARDQTRREWLAVAVVTAIGLGLRLWPIGQLGLSHFDEGIYALAASWSLMPRGLASLNPLLISYAPPAYPILGGLAYVVLGRSDGAMIAVSQVAGTLTIPVVAWLGRRTFGPGSGFAAATFCTFSGPHIASSRMALTDASFLLAWLLAMGAGMRFLERPGFLRAVTMGLAVGMAQQFKYNGWLAGGIVIGTAALGFLVQPGERKSNSTLKTFGWGVLAVGVAWLLVWPWYAFVEAHGGYPALLRHQRSYLGGIRDWWPNLQIQADQAVALAGGDWLILTGVILCALTSWIAWPRSPSRSSMKPSRSGPIVLRSLVGIFSWLLVPAPYWLGLVMFPWLLAWSRPSIRLLGIWWLILSAITPFYHPYARLWLPYHAANWLLMGWLVADGPAVYFGSKATLTETKAGLRTLRLVSITAFGLFGLGAVVAIPRMMPGYASARPGLFSRSDSLYQAAVRVSERLPDDVKELKVMVRPSVSFYLARRVDLTTFASSDQLLMVGGSRAWALVDSAILPSEAGWRPEEAGRHLLDRFAKDWEVEGEFPTNPSLPTLLDLDPRAARSGTIDRSFPLWLLRPRTSKAPK